MPEVRYVESKDAKTGKITQIPYTVSDGQLAEEAEAKDIEKLNDTLGLSWTPTQVEAALKKVITRLIKRGVLP